MYIQVGVTPPPNTPGIVTRADILLSAAEKDIHVLELIRTILEKCSPHVSLQLLDVSYNNFDQSFTFKSSLCGMSQPTVHLLTM